MTISMIFNYLCRKLKTMSVKLQRALGICLLVFSLNAFSQFALDPSYANAGVNNAGVDVSTSMFLPGNKVLVAYPIAMSYPFSSPAFGLRRYNPDGTLDTSFATNGIATYIAANYRDRFDVYTVTMQTDGKIIIAGQTYEVGGFAYYYNFFIFRFNADGTADTGFGTNGLVKYSMNTTSQFRERFVEVAVDGNNRVIAVGYTTADVDQKNDAVAMRFLPNGSLDTSFATGGIFKLGLADSDFFNHIHVLADDSIFTLGASILSGNQNMLVAKINPSGVLDTSFGTAGMATISFGSGSYSPSKLFFKPNNKMMLVGSSTSDLGSAAAFAQLNADGTLDTGFSTDGKNLTYIPIPEHYGIGAPFIVALPDNKYFVASTTKRNSDSTNNYDFAVARIKADTTLDTSFSSNGIFVNVLTGTNEYARGLYLQDDGKPLVLVNSSIRRYVFDLALGNPDFVAETPKLTVAPNPATDKIALHCQQTISQAEIFNIQGKKIMTLTSGFDNIDLSPLTNGVYFVKVQAEGEVLVCRVVKG